MSNKMYNYMKKILLAGSVVLAAISCSKVEGTRCETDSRRDIRIVARAVNDPLSRTVTAPENNFTVNWSPEDNIAVYTAFSGEALPSTNEGWWAGNPVKFTNYSASEESVTFRFDETLTSAQKKTDFINRYDEANSKNKTLDWYAIYPGSMDTPSSVGKAVILFGTPVDQMAQTGYGSTAHLARQDVLFGKATGTMQPEITMKHVGALQQVTMTNRSAENVTVTSVGMSTDAEKCYLTGQFRLNMTGASPFVPTDYLGGTVSSEYELKVLEGTELAPDESATFYFVTPPFTVPAGNAVNLHMTTDKGLCTRTVAATENLAYESGRKYNADVDFEVNDWPVVERTIEMNITNDASPCNSGVNILTGEVFNLVGISEENQAKVDMVSFFTGSLNVVLASPANGDHYPWMNSTYKAIAESWTTRNNTYFKRLFSPDKYAGAKRYSDIRRAYETEIDNWGLTINGAYKNFTESGQKFGGISGENAQYLYVAVKTGGGVYALISVTAAGNGTLTFKIKTLAQ